MLRKLPVAIVIVVFFCHIQAEKTAQERFREALTVLSRRGFAGENFEPVKVTFDHKRGITMVQSQSSKNCYLFDSADVESLILDNPGLKWRNDETFLSDKASEINTRYLIEVQDPVTKEMCAAGQSYWIPSESFKQPRDAEEIMMFLMYLFAGYVGRIDPEWDTNLLRN